VVGIEPRVSSMLGKFCPTELYSYPFCVSLDWLILTLHYMYIFLFLYVSSIFNSNFRCDYFLGCFILYMYIYLFIIIIIYYIVVLGLNSGPCTCWQVLYKLNHAPSPFCFSLFLDDFLHFLSGQVSDSTIILPTP
jgi:hypothetical protein